MKAIVAVDENGAIGYQGKLLYRLHEDMKNFGAITKDSTIIYGHKTLETFPDQKPLTGRRNIILSTQDISIPGADVYHSIYEVLLNINLLDNNFVIGGSKVFHDFFPYIDTIFMTKIYSNAKQADTYFPPIELMSDWYLDNISSTITEDDISFKFLEYHRKVFNKKYQDISAQIIDKLSEYKIFRDRYDQVCHELTQPCNCNYDLTLIVTLQKLLTELDQRLNN